MPQQNPYSSSNERFRKKLFVDTGTEFVEVKARLVEPYSPPTPQPRVNEVKVINAPSHITADGFSSYQVSLSLLFPDKQSFSEYLVYSGWTHKFYDEKGAIYLGTVQSMKPVAVEASRRYRVEITLIMVKKDSYGHRNRFEFQDVAGHLLQSDIEEMANLGLVAVVAKDGQPILYFRPESYITRAEFIAFTNRTRKLMEQAIRE